MRKNKRGLTLLSPLSDKLKSKKNVFVSVTITNDSSMKALNEKYLKRNYPTDVLSFDIKEDLEDEYYLGDVVVNREQAKRQAKEYGNSFEEEISDLIRHGVLHLLGVHHKDDDTNSIHGTKTNS